MTHARSDQPSPSINRTSASKSTGFKSHATPIPLRLFGRVVPAYHHASHRRKLSLNDPHQVEPLHPRKHVVRHKSLIISSAKRIERRARVAERVDHPALFFEQHRHRALRAQVVLDEREALALDLHRGGSAGPHGEAFFEREARRERLVVAK